VKTRRWIVAGLLFAVLWIFVRGPAVTARPLAATAVVGMAVGLPIAYVFRRLYEEEIRVEQPVTAVPYVVLYLLVFFKEVLVANVDVAYRVLVPGRALEPQVILVPLRVETSLGITTIANSITITPGTVALDHDPDRNALYVHMIDGRAPHEVVEPIRRWEDYALLIFDERRSPSDPAPSITIHPPDHPPEPKTVPDPRDRGDVTEDGDGGERDG